MLLLRSPAFMIGMIVIALLDRVRIFGDRIAPYRHDEIVIEGGNLLDPSFRPSWDHPFGLDSLGRDDFSRVLAGAGPILSVALLATLIGIVCGSLLGPITGYFGGAVDNREPPDRRRPRASADRLRDRSARSPRASRRSPSRW